MWHWIKFARLSKILILVLVFVSCRSANSQSTELVKLDQPALNESSGLAFSKRHLRSLWSHNDSGGQPCIYAFDLNGKATGRCDLAGAKARDWEDMASYVDEGIPRILIADSGDNDHQRDFITLYLIDEPDPNKNTTRYSYQALIVTYPDGAKNCEAVCVDTKRREIVLITKSGLIAEVYLVDLPKGSVGTPIRRTAVAAGRITLPFVTAMDIDPTSGDVWVTNYLQAFCFPCRDRNESIPKRLKQNPRVFNLPRLRQIEAVAVNRDSQVWVSSEGIPAPMAKVDTSD